MNEAENNSNVVQVDNANFDSEVLQSKQPVLVGFLTPWSRPCTIVAPVLDEIASERSSKLKVVRINADTTPDLSLCYDVRSDPTLLYFINGSVQAKVVGTATKEAILSKLAAVAAATPIRKAL